MKTSIILLIAMFAIVSCGDINKNISQGHPSVVPDATDSRFVTWTNFQNYQSDDFLSTEFDELKYIVLDNTTEALIAGIDQIHITDSIITVSDNNLSEKTVQFDYHGNFVRQIGSKGKAEGEYLTLGCMTVLDSGEIWIADRGSRRIIVYDSVGKFKREITDITAPSQMVVKDSTLICSYPGYFEDMPFRLKWFDLNGQEKNTGLPYNTPHQIAAGNLHKSNEGEILYSCLFNDTIYNIGINSIVPEVKMNINDQKATMDFLSQTSKLNPTEFQKELFKSNDIINYLDFVKCNGKWIVRWQKGYNFTMSVISDNGSTKKNYKIAELNKANNKHTEIFIPEWFMGYNGGYLIGYMDPMAIEYLTPEMKEIYLNNIMKGSVKPITDKNDILASQNLILTFYRLKSANDIAE